MKNIQKQLIFLYNCNLFWWIKQNSLHFLNISKTPSIIHVSLINNGYLLNWLKKKENITRDTPIKTIVTSSRNLKRYLVTKW